MSLRVPAMLLVVTTTSFLLGWLQSSDTSDARPSGYNALVVERAIRALGI